MKISEIILAWYEKNMRDLPWRKTTDPYLIWLSEIIMQQTRVSQGTDYYNRFAEAFPDLHSLANAEPEKVMKLWQGLGYYSRARNLHAAAKQVVNEYQGKFPRDYQSLMSLKGVGDYTAAAVASIAFNQPVAVVDGNVARVLSRLYAVDEPINTPAGIKAIKYLADNLLDQENPGNHNQAVMEFGALQCTPGRPDCTQCPLQNACEAYNRGLVDQYPVKLKKAKPRKRYFTYFIIEDDTFTYLQKRTGRDIWRDLYEFPLEETPKMPSLEDYPGIISEAEPEYPEKFRIIHVSSQVKHQLTHQTIFATFVHLEVMGRGFVPPSDWKKVRVSEIKNYPLPRLIDRYLEQGLSQKGLSQQILIFDSQKHQLNNGSK